MELICSNAEHDAYADDAELVIVASGADPSKKKNEIMRVDLLDPGPQESLAAFTHQAIAAARSRTTEPDTR